MIYPTPCTDPSCNLAHKTFWNQKLHRGSLYVQLLRTSSNTEHKIVVLSYKTFYYLTDAQKQKKEILIQNNVLEPLAHAQATSKNTAPIYFAAARSRHEYSLIKKNSASQEIHIVTDGPLLEAANEEGALILEKIHEASSVALRKNPIKNS